MRPGLPVWDYLDDLGLAHRLPAERVCARLEDAVAEAEAALLARHPASTERVLKAHAGCAA